MCDDDDDPNVEPSEILYQRLQIANIEVLLATVKLAEAITKED